MTPVAPLSAEEFRAAVLRKCAESAEMKERFFRDHAELLREICTVFAQRLSAGGRVFVMGNGGSACDAMHLAVEFVHPILEKRRSFPAFALGNDTALLTAIGNDSDFSQVFAEPLRLHARGGDIALGISTSGMSANVNYGLQAARDMGLLTIGFSGKDGGRTKDIAEYCLTVPSYSIHRIQEVHTTLVHVMWDMIHVLLGEEDVI